MKARTRVAELRTVFKGGQSELFNGIARLAILYEDLRLEMKEFKELYRKVIELGEDEAENHNRLMYFLRRALGTLSEFGRGLNVIRAMGEFKKASAALTSLDARCIVEADRFIQRHWALIKDLRNEFGGHLQTDGVDFALKHLINEIGSITWRPNCDGWSVGIECDFAGILLAGVITSKLQATGNARAELGETLDVLSKGFNHAQAAMIAFVHAFLWDRFGR